MLFEDLSPVEITTLSQVTALSLAGNLDANDLNVLGNFVSTVGDLIQLLAAQMEYLSNKSNESTGSNEK
jgi:hypothetical protein